MIIHFTGKIIIIMLNIFASLSIYIISFACVILVLRLFPLVLYLTCKKKAILLKESCINDWRGNKKAHSSLYLFVVMSVVSFHNVMSAIMNVCLKSSVVLCVYH